MTHVPLGRDDEREQLLARLARAGEGQGSVVVVEGDGGAGKTALVDDLLATARTRGYHVFHGRSWELSSAVPYESLVAAVSRSLRSLPHDDVTRLTAGLPTLGALMEWLDLHPPAVAPEAFKVRAQEAFAILISRLAAARPVVLALDDIHWADQASLEVLQYVCLDVADSALLAVLTARPEEAELRPEPRRFLAGVRRAPWSSTITLGRLGPAAVASIVDDHLGGDVTPRIHELIASRSGGTPLIVHELLDDLVERGVIAREGQVWRMRTNDQPLPRSARELIRSRLDRVQAEDRAVLEALAVVNGPTDPHVVAALLGIDLASVERSLERLRSIRLAVEVTGQLSAGPATAAGTASAGSTAWTVEHPIIAEVVDAELVDAARRRLHRRLLDVDANAPIGRRARHALLAGEPTDVDATIALLADAGTAALERAAPAAAIEPLRAALGMLAARHEPLRHRIQRDLGIAYLRHLEVADALTHLREAWQRAQQRGDLAAQVELLQPLDTAEFRSSSSGVDESAMTALRQAIAAARSWELLAELGWVHLSHAGRNQSPDELERAGAAVALIPSDEMPVRGRAFQALFASVRMVGSHSAPAGPRVEELLATAERWRDDPETAFRWVLLAFDHAILSGDPALVAACRARHREIQEQTGEPPTWREPLVAAFRSVAEGRLEERPSDLLVHGVPVRSAVLSVVLRAAATRYVEGPEAALALLHDGASEALRRAPERTGRLYTAFAGLVLAFGTARETEAAREAIAEMGADRVLAPVPGFVFGGADALARALAGDPSARAAALVDLDTVGDGRWLPSAWAHVLRARDLAGRERAQELLRAADLLAGLGRSLEAAERTIDAAEADSAAVGADRLERALAVAHESGARWLVARGEAVAPAERGTSGSAPADGPLTGREMEVAELVARGLTNREVATELYISIRTVTSHLDHIYTKLGLSSREDLTVWFRGAVA